MNALAGVGPWHIRELHIGEKHLLRAGEVVVALYDLYLIRETGLPTDMRFGIADSADGVIWQRCKENSDMRNTEFRVEKSPIETFCPDGWHLLVLDGHHDLTVTYERAKSSVSRYRRQLMSYPGDDFVFECCAGSTQDEKYRQCPEIGQHWWTPLYYTASELQKLLTKSILQKTGWKHVALSIPDKIDVELLHFTHHGIVIEEGWVVHFSTCRVPEGENRIKLDPIQAFTNITPYAPPGGPCNYTTDTEYNRQLHRNRAVWILSHAAEWGSYNLFFNNCEHMSRMCKVGDRQSAQVRNGVAKAALAVLTAIVPGALWLRILGALGMTVIVDKFPKVVKKIEFKKITET